MTGAPRPRGPFFRAAVEERAPAGPAAPPPFLAPAPGLHVTPDALHEGVRLVASPYHLAAL